MLVLSALVVILLLFSTGTHQYCVINNLSDGTSFLVYQRNRQQSKKYFEVTIAPPFLECCHPNGKLCPKDQPPNELIMLGINFFWDGFDAPTVTQDIRCDAGGMIRIHGNREKHWAECTDTDGKSTLTNLD
ncbi:hypothetical protein BDB01DRAFT_839461 [Pilobolus umbonatus]|nr:hypothetical protein BDB01DRAFT_839461 [Pilobolus umbonatus]